MRECRVVSSSLWLGIVVVCTGFALFGCSDETTGMMGGSTGTAGQTAVAGSTGAAGSVSTPPPAAAGTGVAGSGAAGRIGTATGVAGTGSSAAGSGGSTAALAAGSGGSTVAVAGTGSAGAAGTGAAGSGGSAAGAGGSNAAAGAGGAGASAAGSGGAPAAMHEDLGKGDGSDVVTIGDSWMNLIVTGIEPSLDKVSGQRYRHYAVPGTLVLNEQIPNQFKQAVRDNPMIKTLVMTGGGNDILTSPCAAEECNPIVDDVAKRLGEMLVEINDAGVQDVIIIGYTYPADESKHESLDHSRMVSMETCQSSGTPRCWFVDSSKLDIMLQDGIHPNAAGCDLIAKTVFDLMTQEGMRR